MKIIIYQTENGKQYHADILIRTPRIVVSDLFPSPVRPQPHTWHKFHRIAKVFAINSTNFLLPPQNQMNYGHIYTSGSAVCEWKNAVPLRKDDDKHMWEGWKYWRRLTTSSCVYKWHQDLYRHWHWYRAFVYRQRNTPPHTIAVSVWIYAHGGRGGGAPNERPNRCFRFCFFLFFLCSTDGRWVSLWLECWPISTKLKGILGKHMSWPHLRHVFGEKKNRKKKSVSFAFISSNIKINLCQ